MYVRRIGSALWEEMETQVDYLLVENINPNEETLKIVLVGESFKDEINRRAQAIVEINGSRRDLYGVLFTDEQYVNILRGSMLMSEDSSRLIPPLRTASGVQGWSSRLPRVPPPGVSSCDYLHSDAWKSRTSTYRCFMFVRWG